MRSEIQCKFVSVTRNATKGKDGGAGRVYVDLNVLQPETGKVLSIQCPEETHGVAASLLREAQLGDWLVCVLDVNTFTQGNRAVLSYRLVDASIVEGQAAGS